MRRDPSIRKREVFLSPPHAIPPPSSLFPALSAIAFEKLAGEKENIGKNVCPLRMA